MVVSEKVVLLYMVIVLNGTTIVEVLYRSVDAIGGEKLGDFMIWKINSFADILIRENI